MMFFHHVIQSEAKDLGNIYYMYTGLLEPCEGI